MPSLRIVGVPEHFNLPFQSGVQRGVFVKNGVNLLWNPVPGGTGAMIQLVTTGEADVAVALTEGVVAAIVSANINAIKKLGESSITVSSSSSSSSPSPILLRCAGEFVTSKLRWMVAAGVNHECACLDDISEMLKRDPSRILRFSVSRLGSGSHLMAYLLAKSQGWPQDRLEFIVHKDFRTMRRGVGIKNGENESADLLMWEWFMTKPFVDAVELKTLGYFDTPWHCFSFIARKDWLDVTENRDLLKKATSIVFSLSKEMMLNEDSSCEEISAHFGIELADAHAWFSSVRYAQELVMPKAMVERVLEALASVGVIPSTMPIDESENGKSRAYTIEEIVDTRIARILTSTSTTSSTSNTSIEQEGFSTQPLNTDDDDEEEEEWELNVPMIGANKSSNLINVNMSITLPSIIEMNLLSTSEISLSLSGIEEVQRGVRESGKVGSIPSVLPSLSSMSAVTEQKEVFPSTLSPGDSLIGAAHQRIKRDVMNAAIGEANERRASIERRISFGGIVKGEGDDPFRKSFVGIDINDQEREGIMDNDIDKDLGFPSSSLSSSSSSLTMTATIRMPTKDSLVPTAGTKEYSVWKEKKKAALDAVLGHLDSFGGLTTTTTKTTANGLRREDNDEVIILTQEQSVLLVRRNWFSSGAAVDIG
jgi:sulfonate transport system substrate-binding protein